jgi:hypothetical protein
MGGEIKERITLVSFLKGSLQPIHFHYSNRYSEVIIILQDITEAEGQAGPYSKILAL